VTDSDTDTATKVLFVHCNTYCAYDPWKPSLTLMHC
jgi:hypothetical protein